MNICPSAFTLTKGRQMRSSRLEGGCKSRENIRVGADQVRGIQRQKFIPCQHMKPLWSSYDENLSMEFGLTIDKNVET